VSHAAAAAALASGAAVSFGLVSVVEHLSARQVESAPVSVALIVRLIRRPLVLIAIVFEIAGFGLQVLAVHLGALVVVQPLLVLALPVAVLVQAVYDRRRPGRGELAAGAAALAGIALFQVTADPADGTTGLSVGTAAAAGAVLAGVIGLAGLVAARVPRSRRVVFLAVIVGVLYGACGPLLKHITAAPSVGHVFLEWHAYALAVVGGCGLGLNQVVFQDAQFGPALAVLTVVEPLTSATLGAFLLHESLPLSGGRLAGWVLGGLIALSGVAILAVVETDEPPAAGTPSEPAVTA
jgi:drug/metabolite transporter (DMT)-like permease